MNEAAPIHGHCIQNCYENDPCQEIFDISTTYHATDNAKEARATEFLTDAMLFGIQVNGKMLDQPNYFFAYIFYYK